MQPQIIQSMDDQVRAIYRALTGEDVAERGATPFTPQVDIIAADGAVVVELALPGLDRDEIATERRPGALVISGIRRDHAGRAGVFHAEIPRGPFLRTIPLPFPIEGEPRIELDRGVLRIHLPLAATAAREGAADTPKSEAKPEQTEERSTGK